MRDHVQLLLGTHTRSVLASMDGADIWIEIALHLPTVLPVEGL